MSETDLYLAYIAISLVTIPLLAYVSARHGILTRDRKTVITAILTTLANAICGLYALLTYAYFVLSSSLATRLGRELKLRLGHHDVLGRTWRQVLGVGLTPSLVSTLAVLMWLTGARALAAKLTVVLLSLYAVSTADTWSSELGMLVRSKPRLILGLRRAETGTSGAVTPLGTAAAIAGSLTTSVIGVALGYCSALPGLVTPAESRLDLTTALILVFLLGVLGEITDSILGCILQEKRACPRCGIVCEHEVHCGVPTVKLWGCRKVSGEIINTLSQCIVLTAGLLILLLL